MLQQFIITYVGNCKFVILSSETGNVIGSFVLSNTDDDTKNIMIKYQVRRDLPNNLVSSLRVVAFTIVSLLKDTV